MPLMGSLTGQIWLEYQSIECQISETEDMTIKTPQTEKQREKKTEKKTKNIQDLWTTTKGVTHM